MTALLGLVSTLSNVKSVSPPQLDKRGNMAVFTVIATTAPSSRKTEDHVRNLRSTVLPKATAGTDLTAYVGGTTAGYIDLADRISDKLPSMIANSRRGSAWWCCWSPSAPVAKG